MRVVLTPFHGLARNPRRGWLGPAWCARLLMLRSAQFCCWSFSGSRAAEAGGS